MDHAHKEKPYLTIVVPAYQEEQRIASGLSSIFAYLKRQSYSFEVLVVDDGSSDGTIGVLRAFQQQEPTLRIVQHERNRGKGAAVRTGMRAAQSHFALIADADGSTPVTEIQKLFSALQHGNDIAIGSRYLPGSVLLRKQPFTRRMMGRAGNLLFRIIFGLRYSDTRCGFKLFSEIARAKIFQLQRLERWGFDTEILVIAKQLGLTVAEVPVQWHDHSTFSNVRPIRDSLRSFKELYDIWRHLRAGHYPRH